MLVTGGAGFIGSNFVSHVVGEGRYDVAVLDSFTYAATSQSLDHIKGRYKLIVGDICDRAMVHDLMSVADVCVNFAAESHNDNSLVDPGPFLQTNILGAVTLMQAAVAHQVRLHQVSTDEVFGDLPLAGGGRFIETTPYCPSSPYAATKAAADHMARAWARSHGLKMTISNCSNNYGPWQHVEKFIPRQITNVLRGDAPQVYGTGANIRDWIHVADHCSAIMAILDHGRLGETYLVGADGEQSNLDVARMILDLCGRSHIEIEHICDRPGHDRRYAIDPTKLRTEIGWAPQHTDVASGLIDTITWYDQHRWWWNDMKRQSESRPRRTATS